MRRALRRLLFSAGAKVGKFPPISPPYAMPAHRRRPRAYCAGVGARFLVVSNRLLFRGRPSLLRGVPLFRSRCQVRRPCPPQQCTESSMNFWFAYTRARTTVLPATTTAYARHTTIFQPVRLREAYSSGWFRDRGASRWEHCRNESRARAR